MKKSENNIGLRMKNLIHSINDTTQQNKILNSNIHYLKDVNDNLIQNYSHSLTVVLELFNIIFQYVEYLDTIEILMNDYNIGSCNLEIDDMISKYKSLNSNETISLTTAFMNKLDEILPLFEKNGIPKQSIEDFSKSVINIQNMIKKNGTRKTDSKNSIKKSKVIV